MDIKQLYTTFVAYIFGFLNGFVSALDSYSGDPMDFRADVSVDFFEVTKLGLRRVTR